MCSNTQRMLLNMRSAHKTHNFTWALWGGMAEADESPTQCLLREISEEMGSVPDISKVYPFDIYESTNQQFRYYTFVCVVAQEFAPVINSEACAYGWFDLGVWPKPLHRGVRQCFASKKGQQLLEIILSQYQ